MPRSSRESARLLQIIAQRQGGYFTAKQANSAGYRYPHLDYHVTVGNFTRIGHGIYRLTSAPRDEFDDLIAMSLWSRDRHDTPQAVVSHESALVHHELTELLPSRIHLTVPPTFRKRPPGGTILHRALLAPTEIEERTGFRVTTPLRTLIDVATGVVSQEQLEKALTIALERGMVTRRSVVEAVSAGKFERLRAAMNRRRAMAT